VGRRTRVPSHAACTIAANVDTRAKSTSRISPSGVVGFVDNGSRLNGIGQVVGSGLTALGLPAINLAQPIR